MLPPPIPPLTLKTKRFYPAGNYTWIVPAGCTSVDVFLVGGGGGSNDIVPGGGGYTKTYKKDTSGWRDGDAAPVTPGDTIQIIVGAGGTAGSITDGTVYYPAGNGGYSEFKNSSYRANGGEGGSNNANLSLIRGGNGGSGASGRQNGSAGSDGANGTGTGNYTGGKGQGHTTRDFGEPTGKRNAGGGRSYQSGNAGGQSDYPEGSGGTSRGNYYGTICYGYGGGGYGGGAGGTQGTWGSGGYDAKGGDGTVLIRYYSYD